MILQLFWACSGGVPAWAMNHASVIPDESGLSGTQTWEFFRSGWEGGHAEGDFVCARAQAWAGELVAAPDGCAGCVAAYTVTVTEIESDCPEPFASNPDYAGPLLIGVGDAPSAFAKENPHPGDAMGWYASFETGSVDAFGFAWDEALDYGESAGPPGWRPGVIYTLWPVVAWELGR